VDTDMLKSIIAVFKLSSHKPIFVWITALLANIFVDYVEAIKIVQLFVGTVSFLVAIGFTLWKWRSDYFRDKKDKIEKQGFF
jgi:hypothetical protein